MENKALEMHKKWNGKLETVAKSKVNSREDLAILVSNLLLGMSYVSSTMLENELMLFFTNITIFTQSNHSSSR